MLRLLRYLLFPISLIYWGIIYVRNKLFDKRILKSIQFDIPIISVGNLSVGGTGKTPMVEYLIRLLQDQYQLATLSRGYKRRSSGFILATEDATAETIGDEPLQIHRKFPNITVSVGEDRIFSTLQLLKEKPKTQVVLLDDAFQHRYLRSSFQILLTAYGQLFTDDWYLPTGNLRDLKSSANRADIIIVTKCPAHLTSEQKATCLQKIPTLSHQSVFFSKIVYSQAYDFLNPMKTVSLSQDLSVLLACGIANTASLTQHLDNLSIHWERLAFGDHHYFTERDLSKIERRFQKMQASTKIILTTEKDASRLFLLKDTIIQKQLPIYCLPIKMKLIGEGAEKELVELLKKSIILMEDVQEDE